MTFEFMN